MAKSQRFEVVYKDGSEFADSSMRQILADKETGVNYPAWKSGFTGSITPLLDAEGKPVITNDSNK